MTVRKRGKSWQVDVTINGTRTRETHETKLEAKRREIELMTNPQMLPGIHYASASVASCSSQTRRETGGTVVPLRKRSSQDTVQKKPAKSTQRGS